MILDRSGKYWVLRVPRGTRDPAFIRELMDEHGLDFSVPASKAGEAVLFTEDPYAAVTFWDFATSEARNELAPLYALIEASRAPSSNRHVALPSDRELWPFQRADVDYILARRNALDGDEPGLGKTPTAIAVANEMQAERIGVICPASIRLQWVKRIQEWTTMERPIIHTVIHGRSGINPRANWTILSYDLARDKNINKAAMEYLDLDLLILDEAHYVKNSGSRRTRAIFGGGHDTGLGALYDRARRTLALTGTPLPNRPREAYTLARGLCFDSIDWTSEDNFRSRYNPTRTFTVIGSDGLPRVVRNESTGRHFELQNRLRAHFMCRHLKAEVLPQLGYPEYDLVRAEETGPIKAALKAERLLDIDPETLTGADAEVLGHIAEARRMMGVALAPQAADYVDMLLDGGEPKICVFAWHIDVLNILEKRLARYNPIRIDGSTGAARKDRLVNDFIRDKSRRVAIGNILSMGVGTDGLQRVCQRAVIAEPDWTSGNNQQCVDRLHRGGQEGTVLADFFVAPGSIGERVLASSLRKLSTTNKVLDKRVA